MMAFGELERHWSGDRSGMVHAHLAYLLPSLDWSKIHCAVAETPGMNHPLQKYLYIKVGDATQLVKSFRYYDELDGDEAMLARIVLLAGALLDG